jgi:sulfonate dioxygenase
MGLQLSFLSPAAKDELALLIAERKILAFPDLDLIDAGPALQQSFMNHFGKADYQPVSGVFPDTPDTPNFTSSTITAIRMKLSDPSSHGQ